MRRNMNQNNNNLNNAPNNQFSKGISTNKNEIKRNDSLNRFGNNNKNTNNTNVQKNFNNIKGNNKTPSYGIVSSESFMNFQNQEYHNLNNYNILPSQNSNIQINQNKNFVNNDIFNKNLNMGNNENNFISQNNRNQIQSVKNGRKNSDNFNVEILVGKKPGTTAKNKVNANENSNINNNLINKNQQNYTSNPSNDNVSRAKKPFNAGPNKNDNNSNNQNQNKQASKTILMKIRTAKTTGIINISNMNLNSLPQEIFDDSVRFDDINWWELVDIKKIDATNNQIDEIFNNENISFEAIPNLNYLKFSGNNFTMIPESIYSLYNLKFLDFADNKIRNLSENLRGLKSLVDLNLNNNNIAIIPNEVGKLSELEILSISQNKISSIPQGLGSLSKLKRIDLSNNFIDFIPNFLGSLYLLEELILFKNKIKDIQPGAFANLTNLKYLDLHNNNLEKLDEIPKSNKLDSLILGYNRLEFIGNLQNCPNLTVLDVNNNKVEIFPEEILSLKSLITLNLMNNSINDIPPALSYLNKLVRLNIEGNPLKKMNSKLRSSNAEQIKSYLKTRIVDQNEIEIHENKYENEKPFGQNSNLPHNTNIGQSNEINISSAISKESKINILNYYQNSYLKIMNLDIENIPVENFKKFKIFSCVGLDMSNNRIKDLSFFELLPIFSDMLELKLNSNKLSCINPKILEFKNIKTLELKNNNISEFLDDINFDLYDNQSENTNLSKNKNSNQNQQNLYQRNKTNNSNNIKNKLYAAEEENSNLIFPYLEYLDLSTNKLRKLPYIIKYMQKLNTLLFSNNLLENADFLNEIKANSLYTVDLGTNKITYLPERLYLSVPNLKLLSVENNEIRSVPTDLCFLNNLNKLSLNGNPIKQLRMNIINGGTKTILEYLRKMHRFTDEELKLESANSNFLNFNSPPEEKTTGRKRVFRNDENVMDVESPAINQNDNLNNDINQFQKNNQILSPHKSPGLNKGGNQNFINEMSHSKENQNFVIQEPVHLGFNNNENIQKNDNFLGSPEEELEQVNQDILSVESEMGQGNLQMFKKAELRKKLNELIRKRANIMKNLGDN